MFDQARADRAVAFIESLKHTKDPWYGVNFDLQDWQYEFISDVFGHVKTDGYRQYNTAYLEVPKKNGKTDMAAACGLYLTCADGEHGAEVYGAAADRQQASIAFDVAVEMVDQSPALKKRIKLVLSQKRMIYLPTKSFYQVLSAEAYTKHGFNTHGVIFDELHAQPDRELYDILTKGSGDARMQPLFLLITTAGDDPDRKSIGWEVHQKAVSVLKGTKKIDNFYAKIYGVDESADWESEEEWKKANPSLGHNLRMETFRAWYQEAKGNPAEERLFRQLRLNQWMKFKTTKWISLEKWDESAGMVVPSLLKKRKCYGGLDLSSTTDISAYSLVFPPSDDDPLWRVLWEFWIPEENIKARVQKDGVPYDAWVKSGLIKTTPGNVIDYEFIHKEVVRTRDLYDIQEIGFDPWHALQLSLKLDDAGLNMVEVRQGMKSMGPPMKALGKLVLGKELAHSANPVARWMFGNLEVKIDENENVRPVKGKGIERIDGIVAMIMGIARAIVHEQENIYNQRGMRSLL